MVKHALSLLCILACSILCLSCQSNGDQQSSEGDTLAIKYAHNLLIVEYADGIDVQLRNPWDTTQTLHRYWLTETEAPCPFENSTAVNIPLHKAGVFTAVHCSLIEELGCINTIAGVCEPEYIHNQEVLKRIDEGKIIDLGSGLNPNLERIMQVMPDAVMPSPFQDNGGYGRLESIGIPIIECADYMEVSPLARAEWMKFYGRLFGVSAKADSLFNEVEKAYLEEKRIASTTQSRPKLMVERPYSGVWYTPGGQSTMGIMYSDAGADYLWKDRPESGSLALSPELILERALEADIWLIKYNQNSEMTYDQLLSDNPISNEFKAFREHNVYACNTSAIPFYEETPFHPERLLGELLQIFHPELSISANYSYFCKLKE